MIDALRNYLAQSYQRDVLGHNTAVEDPPASREFMLAIQAEIARIDDLGLGASLPNRDFASYQHHKALMALVDRLKASSARE